MGARLAMARGISAFLSLFSPKAAAAYYAGHVQLGSLYGYDAARRDGPNAKWRPADGKADLMIARDAKLIRARSRAMVRDNPNMGGAIRKIVNNVVFSGIRPQAQLRKANGERDRDANNRVEAQYKSWADAVGMWEHEKLGIRHCWVDGGFLVHYYPDETLYKAGIVPLGVELLDLDALDISVTGPQENGNFAYKGREYDTLGHVKAYYIWRDALFGGIRESSFTRSTGYSFSPGESVRIDAKFCHLVMEKDRIGQTLPVSWLHACLMTMHNFDEYQTAEQIAARLAAAFAVFLKQDSSAGGSRGLDGAPLAGGETTTGKPISVDSFIAQGRIDVLPPGTSLEIAQNNRPAENYPSYTKTSLRGVSAGVGTSYETFANDYSDASYSSVRQAVLEERRGYRMQQFFLAKQMLSPVWQNFLAWRHAFGFGRDLDIPVNWQFPGWAWVDPVKDANAAEKRLGLAIDTRTSICSENGTDFEETAERLAEENAYLRSLGLIAETDAASLERHMEEVVMTAIAKALNKQEDVAHG